MPNPNYLYKYFTEERIDILKNGLIRYTQPRSFNDPFDSLPYLKSIANHEMIDEYIENYETEAEHNYEKILEEELYKNPQFQNLAQHHKGIFESYAKKELAKKLPYLVSQTKELFFPALKFEGEHKQLMLNTVLDAFNNTIGILCFTEKKDNLLMWSHYANSHKGFVLEFLPGHQYFDRRKNKKQMTEHLKPVRYTKKRPEFIFFDSNLSSEQNMDNWIKNLIWVKSDHWEYEEEWRITTTFRECKNTIKSEGQELHLFPFPYDAIKSIYLGCKMTNKIQTKIISVIKKTKGLQHIKIFASMPDEQKYKLIFREKN